MTINAINNTQKINFKGAEATQGTDVSAFANKNIDLEASPQADTLELTTEEQPKKSKKGLLIGLAALAATAIGVGICVKKGVFKKKDVDKAIEKVEQAGDDLKKVAGENKGKAAEQVAGAVENATGQVAGAVENATGQIPNIIEGATGQVAGKGGGEKVTKFADEIQKVNKDFSGTLKGNQGDNLVELVYKNGKIESSLVKDKDGKEIVSKTFDILEDGSKKITTKKGDTVSAVKHVMKDGKITEIQTLDDAGNEIMNKTKTFEYYEKNKKQMGGLKRFTVQNENGYTVTQYSRTKSGKLSVNSKKTVDTRKAQEEFNKPFEEVLSNKKAEDSAKYFSSAKYQEDLKELNAKKKYLKDMEIPESYEKRLEILMERTGAKKDEINVVVNKDTLNSKQGFANFLWKTSPEYEDFKFTQDFNKLTKEDQKTFNTLRKQVETSGVKHTKKELLDIFNSGNYGENAGYALDFKLRRDISDGAFDPSKDLICKLADMSFDTAQPLEKQGILYADNLCNNAFTADFVAQLKNAKKGTVLTNNAYAIAGNSSYPSYDSFKIIAPKGSKLIPGEDSRNLFPRGAQFEFVNSLKKDGKTLTTLKYILPQAK